MRAAVRAAWRSGGNFIDLSFDERVVDSLFICFLHPFWHNQAGPIKALLDSAR
jgi:hypothetical protein